MQDCGSRGCAACVRHRGFTLIELMIVVAIIIIMAATGAVAIGRSDVNTLQANALQVQALFDRARQTALAQRTWTCVAISASKGTFTLYLQPLPATTTGGLPGVGTVAQTVTLPSTMGIADASPSQYFLYFNRSVSSVYPFICNNDYMDSTRPLTTIIYLWFDGFGHPNFVDLLPGQTEPYYGFATIATKSGSAIVRVRVYASSGVTGLSWVKR